MTGEWLFWNDRVVYCEEDDYRTPDAQAELYRQVMEGQWGNPESDPLADMRSYIDDIRRVWYNEPPVETVSYPAMPLPTTVTIKPGTAMWEAFKNIGNAFSDIAVSLHGSGYAVDLGIFDEVPAPEPPAIAKKFGRDKCPKHGIEKRGGTCMRCAKRMR